MASDPAKDGYMGDCQNCGPFLGPYYNTGPNTGPNLGDPKRDHNFDNPSYWLFHWAWSLGFILITANFTVRKSLRLVASGSRTTILSSHMSHGLNSEYPP